MNSHAVSDCLSESVIAPSRRELLVAGDREPAMAALPAAEPAARIADYIGAMRPRIVVMVLFTMAVAEFVAGDRLPSLWLLANSLFGAGLVIVGAIALNQRLEHQSDAKMPRTAHRPLPAGRLSGGQMTWLGIGTSALGFAHLGMLVNVPALVLAVVSWVIYVWIYTPLKLFTTWQTPIGAVSGAMPILLGAAAAGTLASANAWTLFGILFFWQFPHAMAIAWLYRDQFALADVRVATVADPSGRTAAILSVLGAAALVPVSLVPLATGDAGWIYAAAATLLAGSYLAASIGFFRSTDDHSARRLLRSSIIYLPGASLALLGAALV